MAEEELRRVEQAEQIAAGGGVERARQLLAELVGVVDARSPAGTIIRCADLATRIEASELALHYALCLWSARPGGDGAGLANALFMPEGSAMLELHHPDFNRPYYQRLSATLGVQYCGLTCDPAPTSPPDMVAAVDQATAQVRTLLSQTAA
jgi:hypothetical protein